MTKQKPDKAAKPLVTFPYKLWYLLEECDDGALRWSNDGLSIEVDAEKFVCSPYVPKYFKHTKMTSLVRQLNMYGFKKFYPQTYDGKSNNRVRHYCKSEVRSGVSCYKHEFFRRDRIVLLSEVIRPQQTKSSSKSSAPIEVDLNEEPRSSQGKEINNNPQQLSYATPVNVEFMPESNETQMASISTIIGQPDVMDAQLRGTVSSSFDVMNHNTCFVFREPTFTRLDQHSMDESFDTLANTTFDSEVEAVNQSFERDDSLVQLTCLDVDQIVGKTYSSFSAETLFDDSL